MKLLKLAGAMALASTLIVVSLLAIGGAAVADSATTVVTTSAPALPATTDVSIAYGDWINAIAQPMMDIIGVVLGGVLTWLSATVLPSALRQYVNTSMIAAAEQVLEKGIDYAINAVAGATKGKTLNVSVGNAVVAEALQYVLDHAPAWLVNWLGGAAAIEKMIIARLPLADGARVVTTAASVAIAPASPLAGPASASPSSSS